MKLLRLLLNEANVLNVDIPYNNVSVKEFVKQIIAQIPEPKGNAIAKRIATLIINDERFLKPVTELPDDAPEWAQQALERKDLMAFVLDPVFTDKFEHIRDFINTVYQDATTRPQPEVRAEATKEFNGLAKVEDLDLLYNKSNEYFKKGIYKDVSAVDGMELILKTTVGQSWYKLVSALAFQRVGTVLQNCIGRVWTKEKTDSEGMVIFVLRDAHENTHAAIRISRRGEIQEIKGKNNRPPSQQYMPAVQELLDKFSYTFSHLATNDILGAGYYPIGSKIMPVVEAIDQMCTTTRLGTTGNGNTVAVVTNDNRDLFTKLIEPITGNGATRYRYGSTRSQIKLYESLQAGKIVATCTTEGDELIDAWSSGMLAEDANETDRVYKDTTVQDLVRFVIKTGAFSKVDKDTAKTLAFKYKMHLDFAAPDVIPIKPTEVHSLTVPSGKVRVEEYGGESAKDFTKLVGQSKSDKVFQIMDTPANPERGYRYRSYAFTMLVAIKPNLLLPYTMFEGGNADFDNDQMVKSGPAMAAVANQANAKLPLGICAHSSIGVEGDQYKLTKYKPKQVTEAMFKLDLENMSDVNKYFAAVASTQKWGAGANGALYKTGEYRQHSQMVKALPVAAPYHGDNEKQGLTENDLLTPKLKKDEFIAKAWNEFVEKRLGGKSPTAIYFAPISKGEKKGTEMWVAVDGKEVIDVDTYEESWLAYNSTFKTSRDPRVLKGEERRAVDRMSGIINQLIEKESLAVSPNVSKLNQYLEFEDNAVVSPNLRVYGGVEKRPETLIGTTFVDGKLIRRLTREEYRTWLERADIDNIKDKIPYGLFDNAESTEPTAVFLTKYTKISDVFPSNVEAHGDYLRKGFAGEHAEYVKAFATSHGLGFPLEAISVMKNNSKMYHYMTSMSSNPERPSRYRRVDYPQLVTMGLVSSTAIPDSEYRRVYLTQLGRDIKRRIANGETINLYDLVTPAEVASVDKPVQVAVPRAPGAARPVNVGGREGTKAAQAKARFQELADANGGNPPSRGTFIAVLRADPFNMTPAGASTYYHNLKVKFAQEQGQLGETFTFKEFLMAVM